MFRRKGGGLSSPPYPFTYSGPCIVAGNAWCLHDDIENARTVYGDIPVIAVNGAAAEIKAFALYSKHPERLFRWAKQQEHKFGGDFTQHSGRIALSCTHIDHWWPKAWGGGGSAWDARKVAAMMGFDSVILCGGPMTPGPYVGNHNIGGFMASDDVVAGFQRAIEADRGWHDGCISMSGWTKELLG